MKLSQKRQGRVTGSSVGAILGIDPNRSRDDVMRQMVREYQGAEKEVDEFAESTIFAYGTFHEAGATAEFEIETGITVQECGFFIHPEYDWLGATPDGLIDDDSVFECKCPWGLRDKPAPVPFKEVDDLPHYYAQMQIEMACSMRSMAHFYQWAPNGSSPAEVYYNPEWFSETLPILEVFYNDYLRERELPAAQKHIEPKRKKIESETALRLIEEYDDLLDAIDQASERKKEVLAELVVLAKEKNAEIFGRNLTKVNKKGSVAYAKVVKEHCKGLDLEKYRGKGSEYWVFK